MDDSLCLSLAPVDFFELRLPCRKVELQPLATLWQRLKRPDYLLPNMSSLCHEEHFADVYVGWCAEGLVAGVESHVAHRSSSYPTVTRGDSLELFVDTRDVKTSGYNTRFCHHFFALAEAVDGHKCGEITHFRGEESHPWCSADDLHVKTGSHHDTHHIMLWIPAHCLVGYDPSAFGRLGLAYRVNRHGGEPQHFSAVSAEFQVEQQPALWASLTLASNP